MAARGGRFPPGGGSGAVPLTMVRTKADGGGGGGYRKVVAARAPRKMPGSGCANAARRLVTGKRAEGRPVGGNPVQVRPTPAWQRGIAEFLPRPRREGREAAAGGEAARPAHRARPLPPDPSEDGTASEEEQ